MSHQGIKNRIYGNAVNQVFRSSKMETTGVADGSYIPKIHTDIRKEISNISDYRNNKNEGNAYKSCQKYSGKIFILAMR